MQDFGAQTTRRIGLSLSEMKTIQVEQILGDRQLVLTMLSLRCHLHIHVDR